MTSATQHSLGQVLGRFHHGDDAGLLHDESVEALPWVASDEPDADHEPDCDDEARLSVILIGFIR